MTVGVLVPVAAAVAVAVGARTVGVGVVEPIPGCPGLGVAERVGRGVNEGVGREDGEDAVVTEEIAVPAALKVSLGVAEGSRGVLDTVEEGEGMEGKGEAEASVGEAVDKPAGEGVGAKEAVAA